MFRQLCACLLLAMITTDSGGSFQWNESLSPRLRVHYLSSSSDDVFNFLGNQTHIDHFKLLQTDGHSLLIGARNVVYNLSLNDLTENIDQRITWTSSKRDREMCLVKGKSEDECQNYIRVLASTDNDSLLVCGTNSFNPKCRHYSAQPEPDLSWNQTTGHDVADTQSLSYRMKQEFSGIGYCPHDPNHNSTAIFTGGELYSGTNSDFSGSSALIYKHNIRTEQNDLKQLNSPDFVSSAQDGEYVYFFFRESAVEYINCGKTIYSRVARVCKKDRGGPHKFQNRWTTFLKARINCSIPGEIPFYFNEIQSTTDFISVGRGEKVIFGIFTTADNAMAGSAVCSFRLADINHAFDEGPFKGQDSVDSNWLPVKAEDLQWLLGPQRPGHCAKDSRTLPETTLNFIKQHSLMDETVSNAKIRITDEISENPLFDHGDPLFVKTSLNERLTFIAVDPQIRSPTGVFHDVILVGTTRGKVLKIVSALDSETRNRKPIIIEEIQLFPFHVPVKNIQLLSSKDTQIKRLYVLSDYEVKSVPLHRCSAAQVQSCSACVALQDPHCAWNAEKSRCVDYSTFAQTESSILIQDVFRGKHRECFSEQDEEFELPTQDSILKSTIMDAPVSPRMMDIVIDVEEQQENEDADGKWTTYGLPVKSDSDTVYASSTFLATVVVTALVGVMMGFLFGWLASRRCSRDDYKSCGHRYLEEQHSINKHQESTALNSAGNEPSYTTSPCNNLAQSTNNESKNNLLALNRNINTKANDILEKNNLIQPHVVSTNQLEASLDVNLISSVEVPVSKLDSTSQISPSSPRNNTGTLCKKVYL